MRFWWSGSCLVLAMATTLAAQTGNEGDKKFKGSLETLFLKLDSNKDGKLTKDEFLKMADRAKEKEQARKKLSQAYDKLDPEKKGVTKEQLKRFLDNGRSGETPPAGTK